MVIIRGRTVSTSAKEELGFQSECQIPKKKKKNQESNIFKKWCWCAKPKRKQFCFTITC